MNHPKLILPSILSAPFHDLCASILELEHAGTRMLHFDVMDGHFVPNITIGPLIIHSLDKYIQSDFDVHLMVTNHTTQCQWFDHPRVKRITFHAEASNDFKADINQIQKMGKKAGISIKPGTAVETLDTVLPIVDQILIMTVEPGFGGQSFMPDMCAKIEYLNQKRLEKNHHFTIQVDGGINIDTLKAVYSAGADEFVAGSAIFSTASSAKAYQEMVQIIDKNISDDCVMN